MRTFGLDAILFAVFLLAVSLGVGRAFPWFGTAMGFVSAIAAGRTGYLVHRLELCGKGVTRSKKLKIFADSAALAALGLVGMGFGVVVGAFVGGAGMGVILVLFLPTWATSQVGNWLVCGPMVCGLIGGGYAFVRLQLDLWRYQDAAVEIETAI
jgi:hypothetical protein